MSFLVFWPTGSELKNIGLTKPMHYRNGREAKNGDIVVQLSMMDNKPAAIGRLQNAVAGNDTCNGQLVVSGGNDYGPAVLVGACLCDCLHVDDVAALLAEKGLDKRPAAK